MNTDRAHQGYDPGMEMAEYHGIEVDPYNGMEVHRYPGNASDDEEKSRFHTATNIYDEDPRSRLKRDLKTRQIAMIALGGALGTGLLINT
jgi:amino acid transporter